MHNDKKQELEKVKTNISSLFQLVVLSSLDIILLGMFIGGKQKVIWSNDRTDFMFSFDLCTAIQ